MNTIPKNTPNPKRPSFFLTLLILILCLSLGGAVGMALAFIAHTLKPNDTLESLLMLAGVLALGVPLFNYLSRRFPNKIGFS